LKLVVIQILLKGVYKNLFDLKSLKRTQSVSLSLSTSRACLSVCVLHARICFPISNISSFIIIFYSVHFPSSIVSSRLCSIFQRISIGCVYFFKKLNINTVSSSFQFALSISFCGCRSSLNVGVARCCLSLFNRLVWWRLIRALSLIWNAHQIRFPSNGDRLMRRWAIPVSLWPSYAVTESLPTHEKASLQGSRYNHVTRIGAVCYFKFHYFNQKKRSKGYWSRITGENKWEGRQATLPVKMTIMIMKMRRWTLTRGLQTPALVFFIVSFTSSIRIVFLVFPLDTNLFSRYILSSSGRLLSSRRHVRNSNYAVASAAVATATAATATAATAVQIPTRVKFPALALSC